MHIPARLRPVRRLIAGALVSAMSPVIAMAQAATPVSPTPAPAPPLPGLRFETTSSGFSNSKSAAIEVADRIAVMYRGRIVGIVDSKTSRETLGKMMAGVAA